MKIGSSLALICIGAILAFAVTATPSFFNLHTAGWVLMLIGVIGLLIPARTAGWLGRRVLVRRSYPSGRVEQVPVQPYVARNPGASILPQELPPRPTLLDLNQEDDLIEDAAPGYDVIQKTEPNGYRAPADQPQPDARGSRPAATEVIEDLYEQP
jgi:hypothetical protein